MVIVGAGCAGLACAQGLLSHCPDLLLVEAGARIGGRVREVEPYLLFCIGAFVSKCMTCHSIEKFSD